MRELIESEKVTRLQVNAKAFFPKQSSKKVTFSRMSKLPWIVEKSTTFFPTNIFLSGQTFFLLGKNQ